MKRKVLYALLSAVIAFGLWIYVITAVSPEWEETYYNIPVVLNNEAVLHDRGLMLDEDEVPTVTLKLKGNRADLSGLSRENITLIADLARVYDVGKQQISYSISYPSNVPRNAIEVLSQTPQELTLNITERSSKEVPIVLDYNGTAVPEGYVTDKENLQLDHQVVNVTGPASVVDQIKEARVVINLENQTETIDKSFTYTLRDQEGNTIVSEQLIVDVTEVNVQLEIRRYKEMQLVVNVIPGGGATDKNTIIEMDMETIQVSGSEQMLNLLGDTLELGEIRLGEIDADTELLLDIKLPEGVKNLTGKDQVVVSVKFQNLVKKTLQVSNIQAVNVPDGKKLTMVTRQIEVTVRGPKAQIDALTAKNITVVVDFSGAEQGANTYKAVVNVDSEKFGDVGAVGLYSVSAKVS